jgi:hypothetical protein
MLMRLQPDARDLELAATTELMPCPFCGGTPIVFHDRNDVTTLVVSRVSCTRCHCSVSYTGRDREEGRTGVVKDWSARINNFLNGRVVVPADPLPEAVGAWYRCKNSGGSDYDAYRALIAAVAGK